MPSASDLASFNRKRTTGIALADQIVPKFPRLPADVKKRFPSLHAWEKAIDEEFRSKLNIALRGGPD